MPKNTATQQEEDSKNNKEKIKKLKHEIDKILSGIEDKVSKIKSKTSRKSGGIKRQIKGNITEKIYSKIINFAIKETKIKCKLINRYSELPIELKSPEKLKTMKKYEEDNNLKFTNEEKLKGYFHIYDAYIIYKNKIIMVIEYKSYLENAMLKRCLVDATLTQLTDRKIKYCLCMLETQVRQINRDIGYNSHSLKSFFYEHFETNIDMLLLLDESRKINKDIGEKVNLKEVNYEKLEKATNYFINFMQSA